MARSTGNDVAAILHRYWSLVGASFVAGLVLWAPTARGTPYTYRSVADTVGPFSVFDAAEADPVVNDAGTVVFHATRNDGVQGIFSSTGGAATTVVDRTGPFTYTGGFAINAAGAVAFAAAPSGGGRGLFVRAGPDTRLIVDPAGPFAEVTRLPSIDAAGRVAFHASRDLGDSGIYRGDGEAAPTMIADSNQGFDVLGVFPSTNARGTVVFYGERPGERGIYVGSGGGPTTIATNAGLLNVFNNYPAINDAGTVAFGATTDFGGSGVFTGTGGDLATVVDASGALEAFGNPAINSAGVVAFSAGLKGVSGGHGIFTGPDAAADRVIATGEPLFGSRLSALSFGRGGLNDLGQVAFLYVLEDGRSGIAVATPVPEPSLPALAGSSAGLTILARRRRGTRPLRRHCSLAAGGSATPPLGSIALGSPARA